MMTIRGASIAALVLGLAAGCSQGAPSDGFTTFPPQGPNPASASAGEATFGVDTDADAGSCCVAQSGPGCNDDLVESCVCAQAPGCCSDAWTSSCTSLVDELGCGLCGGGPLEAGEDPDGTGPPPPVGQDCCVGGTELGCNDPSVESCVCNEIPFCCETGWEDVCASAVEALSCGHCGGAGTGEDPPPPGDTSGEPPPPPPGGDGDCCVDNGTPGCDDATVQDCVCMQDAFCCDTMWDDVCVGEVGSFGCGDCGVMPPPPDTSTCCSAQMSGGCDDALVELCVCLIDDYCCTTEWDATCAIFVELFFCGSCS